MTPTYTKTKQFTEWLKQVKPEFEIESETLYYNTDKGTELLTKSQYILDDTIRKVYGEVKAITTDTLHAILWELFDVENPEYTNVHKEVFRNFQWFEKFTKEQLKAIETDEMGIKHRIQLRDLEMLPKILADALWQKYTAGKESQWLTKPDEVLDDIMKVYNEMNR